MTTKQTEAQHTQDPVGVGRIVAGYERAITERDKLKEQVTSLATDVDRLKAINAELVEALRELSKIDDTTQLADLEEMVEQARTLLAEMEQSNDTP